VDRSERFIVQAALPIAPPSFGGDTTFNQTAANSSYAAFGQATIPFGNIWELTLGARWTHDEREIHQVALDNDLGLNPPVGIPLGPTGSPYNVRAEASFEEPTWKIALAVEPIDNVRLYASYDRGYKAGSFPSGAQTGVQARTPLRSELLDNYEIGLKSTVMDGRLRFNAAAFKLEYDDLQVYELLGLNLVTSNAQAEVNGFERPPCPPPAGGGRARRTASPPSTPTASGTCGAANWRLASTISGPTTSSSTRPITPRFARRPTAWSAPTPRGKPRTG